VFTGIVEELGTVRAGGPRLVVAAATVGEDSSPGASVAVNGVCLTVVDRSLNAGETWLLTFDVSEETLRRSSLGSLQPGGGVNLERPVTLLTRLGGHLVQGHVDGVGTVIAMTDDANGGRTMEFTLPPALARYVVEKGSITADGVSLTVTFVARERFGVALVPFTLTATTLGRKRLGDPVNLEVDVMAKYVERLMGRTP